VPAFSSLPAEALSSPHAAADPTTTATAPYRADTALSTAARASEVPHGFRGLSHMPGRRAYRKGTPGQTPKELSGALRRPTEPAGAVDGATVVVKELAGAPEPGLQAFLRGAAVETHVERARHRGVGSSPGGQPRGIQSIALGDQLAEVVTSLLI
jgi:hypothetical protein